MRDKDEVLPEFTGEIFVRRVSFGEQKCGGEHAFRIGGHPACAIGLAQKISRGQLFPIEDADVVHAEKSALKYILAGDVFAIDPPGEVQQQLLEDSLDECIVRDTRVFSTQC